MQGYEEETAGECGAKRRLHETSPPGGHTGVRKAAKVQGGWQRSGPQEQPGTHKPCLLHRLLAADVRLDRSRLLQALRYARPLLSCCCCDCCTPHSISALLAWWSTGSCFGLVPVGVCKRHGQWYGACIRISRLRGWAAVVVVVPFEGVWIS